MLPFLQAEIASPRGQSFDRRFLKPKPTVRSSLPAAWHSRSHAELAHIWPRGQLSDIVRSLRHAKRNA
jgi:hypothetical protein